MNKRIKVATVCLLAIVMALLVIACNGKIVESITAQDVTAVYNGQSHSITVKGAQTDDTLTFSTTEEGTYTETNPSFTDAGEYSVYFKVEREGYTPFEGSATVTITPAVITVTPNALNKIEGEQDPVLTYTSEGNVTGETPAYSGALVRAEGEDVGEYLIGLGSLALKDATGFKASNYTLKLNATAVKFEIVALGGIDLSDAEIELEYSTCAYNGAEQQPSVSVTIDGDELDEADYTLAYSDNINVGTASVTVAGVGNYFGEAQATFAITPKALTVIPDALNKIEGEDDPEELTFTYSGNVAGQTPAFTGALERAEGEGIGSYLIGIGTLALADNEAFEAANYTLVLEEVDFVISEKIDIEDAEITLVNDEFDYTGANIQPAISKVELDEQALSSDCYTVSYSANKDAGTGKVIITGKGIYEGSASADFTISPINLTVTPDANGKTEGELDPLLTYTYSGNVIGEIPSFDGVLFRETGESSGEYKILIGSLVLEDYGTFKADNYNLVLVEVYFVIEQFEVNVENGMACWWLGDDDVESNVTVNALDGDKVEYSKDGTIWTEDQSEITFDAAGVYLIHVKVSRDDVEVAYKAAFMVVEEAIMLTDFEDELIPEILTEARNGGVWSNSSLLEIVEYNGSLMASYPYSYSTNGMNGIIFDMYGNIPAGASYLAMDIYTADILKYKFQHYVYTAGRGSYNNWYTDADYVTEQMATTVYISLEKVSSTHILFSMQINIGSGYSGTIYYDNIRFVKEIPAIPSLEVDPVMMTPANNSIQYEDEILFVWQKNEFVASFDLYIYNDEAGEQLISSYLGLTNNSQLVDLSEALTISQKVYWKLVATSVLDEAFIDTGFFNYSDYQYNAYTPVTFQADDLDGVSWRNNKDGNTWNDMLSTDLVELADGITAYRTGTTAVGYLFGVRQEFAVGDMESGIYDTIAFTLSTDFPGTYTYRVWIYNEAGGNAELTSEAGREISIGKSATTFYYKLTFKTSVTKENMVAYAVQFKANATPVYFHSMGIVDMSYEGVDSIAVTGQDFVLDKTSAELNGTLSWDAVDALTGEYYVELWYGEGEDGLWFIGGETVYENEVVLIDKDMSDYSGYFNYISSGNYECNYKIIAKSALCDAGATTFEGTVELYLTVT